VSNGYSEYSCNGTALSWAAFNGNEEIVRLLLDAGARDDLPTKKSALLTPLERKHHEIAALLLNRASPDVNFATAMGYTALHQVKPQKYAGFSWAWERRRVSTPSLKQTRNRCLERIMTQKCY
jgi:ankyrin repeat protein